MKYLTIGVPQYQSDNQHQKPNYRKRTPHHLSLPTPTTPTFLCQPRTHRTSLPSLNRSWARPPSQMQGMWRAVWRPSLACAGWSASRWTRLLQGRCFSRNAASLLSSLQVRLCVHPLPAQIAGWGHQLGAEARCTLLLVHIEAPSPALDPW